MAIFDTYADTPFQIKSEGQTITLAFKRDVPAVGQGTVTWNIPVPGVDCNVAADGRTGAYAGIVILLSKTPLISTNIPIDGQIYDADSTANYDLHAGDKIDGALVIGAFYECAKKGTNQLTNSLVITDLQANTPYYIGAYAVDCQYRYHTEGVRAYSDQYGAGSTPDTSAVQFIRIGPEDNEVPPVLLSDGTGLVPTMTYQFDLLYGTNFPECIYDKIYRISVLGSDAGTYKDLLDVINKQLSLLDNPVTSPVPPNTGRLFWDVTNKKLFEFNGTSLIAISGVLVEAADPAAVTANTYWHIPTSRELYIRSGSPLIWNPVNVIEYGNVDPRALECTDYWYNANQNQAYVWGGSTWCTVNTLVSATDPSCPPKDLCGAYWFDTTNSVLKKWDVVTSSWVNTTAIFWPDPPNNLPIGTYWIDNSTDPPRLFQLTASPPGWQELPVIVTTDDTPGQIVGTPNPPTNLAFSVGEPMTQPGSNTDPDEVIEPSLTVVPIGGYVYNPETEVLRQRTGPNTFVTLEVIVWPDDPAEVGSCDLWWDSDDDTLYVWDVVNSEWDEVVTFYQDDLDPSLPPPIVVGTVWFNPDTNILQRWDGVDWMHIDFIVNDYDPTQPEVGDAWYNPSNKTWYIWEMPSVGTWVAIDPIDSETDPTMIASGVYWFNTSNNQLFIRQGIAWISVPYTTGSLFPTKGDKYFNTTNNILFVWNGTSWVPAELKISVAFNPTKFCGSDRRSRQTIIAFITGQRGSGMNVKVLKPGAQGVIASGHGETGPESIVGTSAFHYPHEARRVQINSSVPEETFLWSNLVQGTSIDDQFYGTDGVSEKPSYMELGVGTDGTGEERRELVDTIRHMLGYPIVAVELTKEQLDKCVSFAIEQLRARSSLGYKRGFFFLDIVPRQQKYVLSNKKIGYHKIVNVASVMRFTSAFLSSAHGAGVYGQVVLQHLYNMGTYDLTSFHLVSQYIEQLEMLFATRLTFHWDEPTRRLDLYNSFTHRERVLLDTTIERTEQEIIKDRWSKNWIREWALAEAKQMLGNARSKYGSLPGAGGGITLNGSELLASAAEMKRDLLAEIDDYIVNDAEDLGMGTQFLIG